MIFMTGYRNKIMSMDCIGHKEFKKTEIGRIPKEWEVVKLGDSKVTDTIYYGITAKASNESTGLKMLRTTDISNYKFDYGKLPSCEITDRRNQLNQYKLFKGDLIIARAGTVGVSVLVDEDYNDAVFGSYLIKVKLKSGILPKFIHYFLQSSLYWNHIQKAQGSTLKNINLPLLKSLVLPLPPLPEQRKIAEILSTVDQAIQKIIEAIEKTQRLKKGLMQELLTKGIGHKEFKKTDSGMIPKTWELKKLEEISVDFVSGGTPSTSKDEYWNGDIPWMTSAFITEREVKTGQRFITNEGLKKSATKIVPKNNLLVATRVGIGKAAVNRIDIAISQDLTGIIIDDNKAIPDFIYWHIVNSGQRLKSMAQGSTIKGILREDLRKISISLPPLPEQQKIAEILSSMDKRIETLRKRKERLEKVKRGLMEDLLTGKKRVKLED